MLLVLLALLGCRAHDVEDRLPGERAPLTASCDDLDPGSCLLPWPSSTFMAVDPSTETGLRVQVDPDSLRVEDRPDYLNAADGFSRVTGVAAHFELVVDPDLPSWDPADSLSPDSLLQVIVAEPGHPLYGERVAYRTEVVDGSSADRERSLLIGRPVEVLPENAEHVVVVLDAIGEEAPRPVRLALGLEKPRDEAEAALQGYHAPTRTLLEETGVDVERVARVWDFTTRSNADTTRRLHAMMDALDDAVGDLGVEIDLVKTRAHEEVDLIMVGRLTGAPSFLDADGYFVLDADGNPTVTGTAEIPFRLMVPAGEGDYHLVLYGHGTGGEVTDDTFDVPMGGAGIGKLNLRFDGWTGSDFIDTLLGFGSFLDGSERSTAGLAQALAGGTVLLTALDGVLGDAVSAETVAGEENPAAGRRPIADDVAWAGGSMGGTMGAVVVAADPRLTTAVLNVPGAGWTHMIPHSLLFGAGMESILLETYPNPIELHLAMVMAQTSWDDVDGAVWADEALAVGGAFLLQESIGDPVLPNLGTELLANALGAQVFTPDIDPILGLQTTEGVVTSGAALEQFRVPDTGVYDVHGFAARGTLAGDAAMEQILEILESAWEGSPRMSHPSVCTESGHGGACDFEGMW